MLMPQNRLFGKYLSPYGNFLDYPEFLYTKDVQCVKLARVRKTPSAMLTGKFLRIRKVFATSLLFAGEFPDILENVWILYKISR